MKTFNLSDWALGHRSLVWYFMIAFMAAGLFAYLQLGRQEDPDFTIKTMVIGAQWPGASPEEMTRQVTDKIEKKLEELELLTIPRASPLRAKPPSSSICATRRRLPTSPRPGRASAT